MLSLNKNTIKPVVNTGLSHQFPNRLFRLMAAIVVGIVCLNCSSPQGTQGASASTAEQSKSPVTARQIVKRGSVSVRVPDVEVAEKSIGQFLRSKGGFVSQSHAAEFDSATPRTTLTLRVPSTSFDETVAMVEALGTRMNKSVSAEDLTSEIVDLEARLKIMTTQEESFRRMLGSSSKLQDNLALQERIMRLRQEIEQVGAQRRLAKELVALSTLEVELVSEARTSLMLQDKDWLKESWNVSSGLLGQVVQWLGSMAVFFAVFSPLWAPCVGLVWWVSRRRSKVLKESA